MPIFAVIGFDRLPKEADARNRHRPEHRDYVMSHLEPVLCAGALLDGDRSQCGSLYVFKAESADEVRAWLAQEPFVANGIYETLAVREIETSILWTVPETPIPLPS